MYLENPAGKGSGSEALRRLQTYRYLSLSLGKADPVPEDFFSPGQGIRASRGPARTGESLSSLEVGTRVDTLLATLPLHWGKKLFSSDSSEADAVYGELEVLFEKSAGPSSELYNAHLASLEEKLPVPGITDPIELASDESGFPAEALNRLVSRLECSQSCSSKYRRRASDSSLRGTEPVSISFENAESLVCAAADCLGVEIGDAAREIFLQNWVDAEPRPGKRGGAFTHPGQGIGHPFVFLNYTGGLRDVVTLGHEIFHGIHFLLRGSDAPAPGIPEMEMISTLGEFFVLKQIQAEGMDPEGTCSAGAEYPLPRGFAELLCLKVYRQACLFQTEREFLHSYREEGRITREKLEEIWRRRMGQFYPGSSPVPESYGRFWITNRHFFHFPFYGINYSLGGILALYILRCWKEHPGAAGEQLFSLMSLNQNVSAGELIMRFFPASDYAEILGSGLDFLENEVTAEGTESGRDT